MRRDIFLRPKVKFGPDLVFEFIKENPGLSSSQITYRLNVQHGLAKKVTEIHGVISVLRRRRKIKVGNGKGPAGGMVYEAI